MRLLWRFQGSCILTRAGCFVFCVLQNWATARIEQNVVGVLIFVAIELMVAPRRAVEALKEELAVGLDCASAAAATIWEAQIAGGGGACGPCRSAASANVAAEVGRLRASLARQRTLLSEAADEPDWAPLSAAASSSRALPLRAGQALEEAQGALVTLLGLMHAILEAAAAGGGRGGAPDRVRPSASTAHLTAFVAASMAGGKGAAKPAAVDPQSGCADGDDDCADSAALGRLVGPCAPALRLLLARLRERYGVLTSDLKRGSTGKAADAAAVAAGAAATAFEAKTAAVFVGLLRAHRVRGAPVVPSRVIVPFIALCWCTRALTRNADALGTAAAELLQRREGEEEEESGAESAAEFAAAVLEDEEAAGEPLSPRCPVCHKPRAP